MNRGTNMIAIQAFICVRSPKLDCRVVDVRNYYDQLPRGETRMNSLIDEVLGAVEKQKLVYILNRDNAAKLTISSPLEAHKAHTIVFDCIGLDVGFQNPIFACIEVLFHLYFILLSKKCRKNSQRKIRRKNQIYNR